MQPQSSSSETSASSESDSDTIPLARPKFVRKAKPEEHPGAKEVSIQQQRLSTLDQIENLEAEVAPETQPAHVVDDTDGLDPEGEYMAWKQREIKRMERDTASADL